MREVGLWHPLCASASCQDPALVVELYVAAHVQPLGGGIRAHSFALRGRELERNPLDEGASQEDGEEIRRTPGWFLRKAIVGESV